MAIGLIGRKLGMMRLYDGSGRVRGVTVIQAQDNRVTEVRTLDRDGYVAVQVAARGDRKRATRPERGHLRKAGVDLPLTELREFAPDGDDYTLGQELTVEQFQPGEFVSVTGTSKGRGFAGGVRRHNFRGGPKTHGQSDRHRAPGSIGAGTTPGRVWKGLKMAGHMGSERKTVLNLLVVQTDAARGLLLVEGSVPGPKGALVFVEPGRRPALKEYTPPEPFAEPAEETAPPVEATEAAPRAVAGEPAGEALAEQTEVSEEALEAGAAEHAADAEATAEGDPEHAARAEAQAEGEASLADQLGDATTGDEPSHDQAPDEDEGKD